MIVPFQEFPKIPRLKRDCVITEKIDGTNAQIHIAECTEGADFDSDDPAVVSVVATPEGKLYEFRAGSRSRWITPGKNTDNFGFAGWVRDNCSDLAKLGPGQHFGEWYGAGIQRGYGLTERRFALFNTARWNDLNPNKPSCCGVVPVLYVGPLGNADRTIADLERDGSQAVPGYMRPEGVVVFHSASGQLFKQLIENDDVPKGVSEKRAKQPRDPNIGGRRKGLDPAYTGPERRSA